MTRQDFLDPDGWRIEDDRTLTMTLRSVMFGLLATILMTASLRGEEPAPDLNGRWTVSKLVIDGKLLSLSKPPEDFWFDVDGNAWHYSFVVDGKRVTARFKTTLAKNDTEILVDADRLRDIVKEAQRQDAAGDRKAVRLPPRRPIAAGVEAQ